MIDGDENDVASKGVGQAAEAAIQILKEGDLESTEEVAAGAFLRQVHANASQGISKMPRDLFFPRQLAYGEERTFPLPGEMQGVLSIDFSARFAPSGHCLEQAKRRVTTRAAGKILTSEESWHLQM